jgi:tryptophanyl-tRNA synthetase
MSKSSANAVYLKDSPEVVRQKLKPMVTDPRACAAPIRVIPTCAGVRPAQGASPRRRRRSGRPAGCRSAGIGCLDCKGKLIEHMLKRLEEIHARGPSSPRGPTPVWDILREGSKKARAVAQATMADVRAAMKIKYEL